MKHHEYYDFVFVCSAIILGVITVLILDSLFFFISPLSDPPLLLNLFIFLLFAALLLARHKGSSRHLKPNAQTVHDGFRQAFKRAALILLPFLILLMVLLVVR